MATTHRTRVLYLGNNTYAAVCSCSWAMPETPDKTKAQADANRHAYKFMTKEDNSQLELEPVQAPVQAPVKAPGRR